MEACSGAHHWGRLLTALGHRVGIMAPRFVAPYRKGGKNDGNDAEAICEAVARPGMPTPNAPTKPSQQNEAAPRRMCRAEAPGPDPLTE